MRNKLGVICLHGKSEIRWRGGVPMQCYGLTRYLNSTEKWEIHILTYHAKENRLQNDSFMNISFCGRGKIDTIKSIITFFKKDFEYIHIFGFASKRSISILRLIKLFFPQTKLIFSVYDKTAHPSIKKIAYKIVVSCLELRRYYLKKGIPTVYIPLGIQDEFYGNKKKKETFFSTNTLYHPMELTELTLFIKELKRKDPNFKLIVGSRYGPETKTQHTTNFDRMNSYCDSNKNIKFTGWCDVKKQLSQNKFFVLLLDGTHTRTRPPLSILEAMASGCVVITSKTEDITEILNPGINGLFFEGDIEPIWQTITDENETKRLIENAKKTAELYNWGNIGKLYHEVYS